MKKHTIIFLMIFVYVTGISGYGYFNYLKTEKELMDKIDKTLFATASALPFIIGEKYHDNIVDKNSVTEKNFMDKGFQLSKYARISNLTYLYSLILDRENKIRFTSTSFTEEDIKKSDFFPFFFEYEDKDISEIVRYVIKSGEIQFETASDEWGKFRAIYIPIKRDNLTYVVCADILISDIDAILNEELFNSVLTALFFLILLIPVVILYIRTIEQEKKNLELIIDDKTKELVDINKDLKKLSNQLAKYLSPQIYNSIFTSKKEVKVESKRKKLTIFFSDIKDFTKITEHLEAEDLTYLLNNYLNEMSLIAMKYGATIDKYIGDAIVIFFGDPESKGVKEDALLCVSMAIEMKLRMEELRRKWEARGVTQPFKIRMGINTGYCTVGNFGSESQLDYTIIGSNVNLTSRLESAAEVNEILISKETYLLIKDNVNCVERGKIVAKGFEHPIQTYQVTDNYHRNYVEEKLNGFSVAVDFDNPNVDKTKIVHVLEDIIKKLEN